METRTLDPADIGRAFDIRSRSFGPLPDSARPGWEADVRTSIDERRAIGAYDGGRLVGRALIWSFRQWWGGRDLAMAGVAGVVVAPEYRGRGVGSLLMDAIIERGGELGHPLSALYPATVPVYRRRGWEVVGVQHRVTIEARLLRELRGGATVVRQAGPDDAAEMVRLQRLRYSSGGVCGAREQPEAEMRKELEDTSLYSYLAPDGFVMYGWEGSDLVVYQLVAARAETSRALWSVVGSGSSVAKNVHAYLAPDDPVHLLIGETASREVRQTRWMLRCLDASAALSGRGYPRAVEVDVPVVLEDAQVGANRLTGRLQVSGGSGELVEAAAHPDAVRLGANGLAALYAGTATATLSGAGLLTGGGAGELAALDAAFAGRPAYLLDYF